MAMARVQCMQAASFLLLGEDAWKAIGIAEVRRFIPKRGILNRPICFKNPLFGKAFVLKTLHLHRPSAPSAQRNF